MLIMSETHRKLETNINEVKPIADNTKQATGQRELKHVPESACPPSYPRPLPDL